MNPIRLKGLTPDEFERLCLELVQKSFHAAGTRCGGISDPDQGVDIEATIVLGWGTFFDMLTCQRMGDVL